MEISELCMDTVKTINLKSGTDTPPSIPCSSLWRSPAFFPRLCLATWLPEALPNSSSASPLPLTLCHPAWSYLSSAISLRLIPLRRNPTPICLPGKSHGGRSLMG